MHSKKCFGFRAQECPNAPGLGDKRIDLFTVKVNSSSFLEKNVVQMNIATWKQKIRD